MTSAQYMASFLVLCLAGAFNAGYLVWAHRQKKPLVCPLDHDCSTVTESKWSQFFFIRNDTLGLFFFLSMLLGSFVAFFNPAWASFLSWGIFLTSGFGFLFSLFLIFIQLYVLKDYCFYCGVSAFITLLLFLNSIAFVS